MKQTAPVIFLVYGASNFLLFLSVGYFAGISLWISSLLAAIPVMICGGAALLYLPYRRLPAAANTAPPHTDSEPDDIVVDLPPVPEPEIFDDVVELSDIRSSTSLSGSDASTELGEVKSVLAGAMHSLEASKARNDLILQELNRRAFDSGRSSDEFGEMLSAVRNICSAIDNGGGDDRPNANADAELLLAGLRAAVEKLRIAAAETSRVSEISESANECGRRARLISVNAEVITRGRSEDIAAASLAGESDLLLRSSESICADLAHLQASVIDAIPGIEHELSGLVPEVEKFVDLLTQRERDSADVAHQFREFRDRAGSFTEMGNDESALAKSAFRFTTELISELESQAADLEKIDHDLSKCSGLISSMLPDIAGPDISEDNDPDILETGPPIPFYREPVHGSGQDILEL